MKFGTWNLELGLFIIGLFLLDNYKFDIEWTI